MPPTIGTEDRSTDRILLTSPPWSEAVDRACWQRITDGAPRDRDVLVVSYDRPAESVVENLRVHLGERPRNLGVVDVGGAMRSTTAANGTEPRAGIANVAVSMGDSSDLDDQLGVVEEFLEGWDGGGDSGTTIAYVDSLTGMIHRIGHVAAMTFVDSIGELLSAEDRAGYFRIERSVHGPLTLAMLEPRFDSFSRLEGDDWSDLPSVTDGIDGTWAAPDSLSAERTFDLLSHPRRRLLLHGLRLAGGRAPLSELAAFVARRETGSSGNPFGDSVSRVYTGLWHVHLPKLVDVGVVSFDEADDSVELVDPTGIEPYLSLTSMEDLNE